MSSSGFGGAGVARLPEGRDMEWLGTHCWICHRSAKAIAATERARLVTEAGAGEDAATGPSLP
jgi:hypothetical protein